MARLFTIGMETGDTSEWTATTGSPGPELGTVNSGTYSLFIDASASAVNARKNFTALSSGSIWLRFYFRLGTIAETTATRILGIGGATTSSGMIININGMTPYLSVFGGTTEQRSVGPALSLNQWYCFEVYVKIGDATVGEYRLRVDGTDYSLITGVNTLYTNTSIDRVLCGSVGTAYTYGSYWDDIALNDDSGSSDNSWVGQILTETPVSAMTAVWLEALGYVRRAVDDPVPVV